MGLLKANKAVSAVAASGVSAAFVRPSGTDLFLADSDFTTTEVLKSQACGLVFGAAGHGKTTFCTRMAPGPLAFINFDGRAAHAVKVAREEFGRVIHFTRVLMPSSTLRMDAAAAKVLGRNALGTTMKNFEIAVRESQRGNIRTIALDTGTELSDIMRVATTGTAEAIKGDYGKSKDLLNREWWHIINTAREGNAHLIILARASPIWENNEPTGKFRYRGPEVMEEGVDWAGHIRIRRPAIGASKHTLRKEFEIEVTKGGVNIEELGSVYTKDQWDDVGGPFTLICMGQYPESTPDEWS